MSEEAKRPDEAATRRRAHRQPPAPRTWLGRLWDLMLRGGSAGWLISTICQALLTWGFIGLAKLSEGWPWEAQAKSLAVIGIIATWCMALRTIRARLLELVRAWRKVSKETRAQAEASPGLPMVLKAVKEGYVKAAMLRLRIIAAGLTMPFFILPIFTASLCLSMCWQRGDTLFLELGLICAVMAVLVGCYFHWSILPQPARAVADARTRLLTAARRRRTAH